MCAIELFGVISDVLVCFFLNTVAKLSIYITYVLYIWSVLWFNIDFFTLSYRPKFFFTFLNRNEKWKNEIFLLTYWETPSKAKVLAMADCRYITLRIPLILAWLWSTCCGISSFGHGDRSVSWSVDILLSLLLLILLLSTGRASPWCSDNMSKNATNIQSLASIVREREKRKIGEFH